MAQKRKSDKKAQISTKVVENQEIQETQELDTAPPEGTPEAEPLAEMVEQIKSEEEEPSEETETPETPEEEQDTPAKPDVEAEVVIPEAAKQDTEEKVHQSLKDYREYAELVSNQSTSFQALKNVHNTHLSALIRACYLEPPEGKTNHDLINDIILSMQTEHKEATLVTNRFKALGSSFSTPREREAYTQLVTAFIIIAESNDRQAASEKIDWDVLSVTLDKHYATQVVTALRGACGLD